MDNHADDDDVSIPFKRESVSQVDLMREMGVSDDDIGFNSLQTGKRITRMMVDRMW